jgi:iron-sulfur cluster assembly accessory protein
MWQFVEEPDPRGWVILIRGGTQVITITDRARAHVLKLIQDNNLGDVALRFGVTGGGCSGFNYNLTFDREPKEGDKVYEFSGLRIIVDKLSRPFVVNTEIDWEESLYGAGFTFRNPQATSTCGCGQSFGTADTEAAGHDSH